MVRAEGRVERLIVRLSRKRGQRSSPNWAFMELFRVPNLDFPEKDYLWRLRVIQTPLFGIYLHKLCGPDSRSCLHNHPWSFVSFVLRGGYTEYVPGGYSYAMPRQVSRVNVKRFNNSFHWIDSLWRTPTWTLVFVGRRKRIWGYREIDGTYTDFDKHRFMDQFNAALESRGGDGMM